MSIPSATTRKRTTLTEAFLMGTVFGALSMIIVLAVLP